MKKLFFSLLLICLLVGLQSFSFNFLNGQTLTDNCLNAISSCNCTYGGKSYSPGSNLCMNKYIYTCEADGDGEDCQWVDSGYACE